MAGKQFIQRRVQVALLLLSGVAPGMSAAEPVLLDRRAAAGIDYRHVASPTESKYLVETMGGGVALLDFDADGGLNVSMQHFTEKRGVDVRETEGRAPVASVSVRGAGPGSVGIAVLPREREPLPQD